jgi:glycosyltransferase involved in cell wall biosynthesis
VFPYFSCFTVKLVSLFNKSPAVYTWHEVWDDYWYEYMGKAGFFGKMVEIGVSKISGSNIAVSGWTQKRLQALGVPKKRISVVPNGIDLQEIYKLELEVGKHLVGSGGKVYDIIFAGRLIKDKHVDVLLKTVSLLKADHPGITCCIVGDGPEKKDLMALSNEMRICKNVEFAGFQEYNALIRKLQASKVFVLPSSREGFGMVVIEAFACGVPVVTVKERYNASQGLVEDGVDGFTVPLDASSIAEAVSKILQGGQCYEYMSKAASQKAKDYDWNEALLKLNNIYEAFE